MLHEILSYFRSALLWLGPNLMAGGYCVKLADLLTDSCCWYRHKICLLFLQLLFINSRQTLLHALHSSRTQPCRWKNLVDFRTLLVIFGWAPYWYFLQVESTLIAWCSYVHVIISCVTINAQMTDDADKIMSFARKHWRVCAWHCPV